jgi:hypothetical protein
MTPEEYKALPVSEAIGRNVRLLREVRNGDLIIPEGTVCTIAFKHNGGFNIVGPKCELCGVQVKVADVPRSYVRLTIPEELISPGGNN